MCVPVCVWYGRLCACKLLISDVTLRGLLSVYTYTHIHTLLRVKDDDVSDENILVRILDPPKQQHTCVSVA